MQQQSGQQGSSFPLTALTERAILVEGPLVQMKWKNPQTPTRASDYQLRCLTARLGSSLCRELHKRGLVSTGTVHAHQLSGTASNNFSSEDLPEGSLRDISVPSIIQCHSSDLHQQHERCSVKATDRIGQGTALNKDITSTAQHIPRVSNTIILDSS